MKIRHLPQMERLPEQGMDDVFVEFYRLKPIVKNNMSDYQKNYIIIRLATIVEQFFRCIVAIKLEGNQGNILEKVQFDAHIIDEVANTLSRLPKKAIRNYIVSLTRSFQNTKDIINEFGMNVFTDTSEKESFEKLFRHRHHLVHSVDQPSLLFKEIQEYYDLTEKLMERMLNDLDRVDLSFYFMKGNALRHLEDNDGSTECFERAMNHFEDAVKSNPDDTNSHFGFALAQHSLMDYDAAIKSFDEVLRLEANNTTAHLYKGKSLFFLERYDEAIKCFDVVLVADPNNAYVLRLMGVVLHAIEKRESALAYLDRAIMNEPGDAVTYLVKRDILKELGLFIWAGACNQRFDECMRYAGVEKQIEHKIEQSKQ